MIHAPLELFSCFRFLVRKLHELYLCSLRSLGKELLVRLILFRRYRESCILGYSLECILAHRALFQFCCLKYYLFKLFAVPESILSDSPDVLADNYGSELSVTFESSGSNGRNLIFLTAYLYG